MAGGAPGRLSRIPLLVILIGAVGLAMLIPAGHAAVLREHAVARAFAYSSLLVGGLAVLLALATRRDPNRAPARGLLPVLAAIYVLVPAAMAIPLTEAVAGLRYRDAWFEMVAAFTTTGGSLIATPRLLADPVHLWRGLAGWSGGLFILVAAMAYLAPLRLGGFELLRPDPPEPGSRATAARPTMARPTMARPEGAAQGGARGPGLPGGPAGDSAGAQRAAARNRLRTALAVTWPWYAGATLVLWLALAATGMAGFPAMMLAMATLSTSGVLPRESLGAVGLGSELLLCAGMVLALSRALTLRWRPGAAPPALRTPWRDPELRLALMVILAMAGVVVARHWLGAYEAAEGEDLPALGYTAWGALFTGLSFLTTTGFVSQDWIAARAWSGLTPPGLVLMGLALLGGGVATTAGGVKLLRVHAMGRLGRAELNRMIYPSIVEDGSERARFLATRGARDAWLFAMVFAIVAVALVGLLILTGEALETALILAIAALTTTGPLIEVAGDAALTWSMTAESARPILAIAMIVGRLEILVVLALALAQIARD